MHPWLQFMQDNARGHSASATQKDLLERGIRPIFWPAFSPDLNLIETIWNMMKNWIVNNCPEKMSYDHLRKAVRDAWDAIPPEALKNLLSKMWERCEALILANGMHIPY